MQIGAPKENDDMICTNIIQTAVRMIYEEFCPHKIENQPGRKVFDRTRNTRRDLDWVQYKTTFPSKKQIKKRQRAA